MAGTAFSGRRPKLAAQIRAQTRTAPSPPASQPIIIPDWLDKAGAALYAHLTGELAALGLFSHLDSQALAHYCQASSDYIRFTKKIRELNEEEDGAGDLHRQGDSYQNIHPLHGLRDRAEKRADTLAKQFGLTPLARKALADLIKAQEDGDAVEGRFFS